MTRALNIHLGWSGRFVPPHLRRRMIASGLVVAAAVVMLSAKQRSEPSRHVVVAAHDLAAGARLTAGDLRVVSVPAAAVPAGAPQAVSALVGRTVNEAVAAHEALTSARLSVAALPESGLVAAPVRLVDPAVGALLHPGALVDVLSAPGSSDTGSGPGIVASGEAQVVARGVRVVSVPATDAASGTGGTLVVLEVSRRDALALANAEAGGRLSVTLLSG